MLNTEQCLTIESTFHYFHYGSALYIKLEITKLASSSNCYSHSIIVLHTSANRGLNVPLMLQSKLMQLTVSLVRSNKGKVYEYKRPNVSKFYKARVNS